MARRYSWLQTSSLIATIVSRADADMHSASAGVRCRTIGCTTRRTGADLIELPASGGGRS